MYSAPGATVCINFNRLPNNPGQSAFVTASRGEPEEPLRLVLNPPGLCSGTTPQRLTN